MSDKIQDVLMTIISSTGETQKAFGIRYGYTESQTSLLFNEKLKPHWAVEKLIRQELADLSAAKECPKKQGAEAVKPIGQVTTKWDRGEVSAPYYADMALSRGAIEMAAELHAALQAKLQAQPAPPQAPPTGTTSAVPSPEIAVALAEADRRGDEVHTMSTGTVTPSKP